MLFLFFHAGIKRNIEFKGGGAQVCGKLLENFASKG